MQVTLRVEPGVNVARQSMGADAATPVVITYPEPTRMFWSAVRLISPLTVWIEPPKDTQVLLGDAKNGPVEAFPVIFNSVADGTAWPPKNGLRKSAPMRKNICFYGLILGLTASPASLSFHVNVLLLGRQLWGKEFGFTTRV